MINRLTAAQLAALEHGLNARLRTPGVGAARVRGRGEVNNVDVFHTMTLKSLVDRGWMARTKGGYVTTPAGRAALEAVLDPSKRRNDPPTRRRPASPPNTTRRKPIGDQLTDPQAVLLERARDEHGLRFGTHAYEANLNRRALAIRLEEAGLLERVPVLAPLRAAWVLTAAGRAALQAWSDARAARGKNRE